MKSTSYKTGCGGSIYLTEGVREHLEAHSGIHDLIPEIASRVTLPTDGSKLARQVSLGRVVGQSSLINTKKIGLSETAWFAVRKNRMKASRVVPDAGPADTDLVSIVANSVEKKYPEGTIFKPTKEELQQWREFAKLELRLSDYLYDMILAKYRFSSRYKADE